MTERIRGYVSGSNRAADGRNVWSVRAKDPASQYNGQWFVVASVHGGLELARGLNVNFAIGTIDDPSGKKVSRAVDICLEAADGTVST